MARGLSMGVTSAKVYTNLMDGRGHTQAHHMGGKLSSPSALCRGHTQAHHMGGKLSSPLCPCNKGFNSASVLLDHLDLKHNSHPVLS